MNVTPASGGSVGGLTVPLLFPDNHEFWFETVRMIDAASYGGGELGEVVSTSQRITSGDFDSWYTEWNATADRVAAQGMEQLARGHRVSARDSFLRASSYYRASEFFLHGNPDDPRINDAYTKSIGAYKAAAVLFDTPIQPVEIPFENTTLPAYFHRVDSSGTRRPLLICHTGFDGSAEELHWGGARAAVERGYNVLVFDGPGQYGPIHREGLPFRADWETVITPVVDFALTLPEVDATKIALMGVSLGGYLAPRAAAFEKRLAAVIASDGVYDFGAALLVGMKLSEDDSVVSELNAEHAPELDRKLAKLIETSPVYAWALTHGPYAFGVKSPRAFVRELLAFNLGNGIAEKISCPTLVCDAEGDLFLKGQPATLYDHLTCQKTLITFTNEEGAGSHCQQGAARLSAARIYDWLDETLGRVTTEKSKIELDSRLEPRIRARFAGMKTGMQKQSVTNRAELLAQEYSPESLAAHKQIEALFNSMDSEDVAPSKGLTVRTETITSAPDGNTILIQFIRPDNDQTLPCVYYIHGGRMEMSSCYEGNYKTWGRMIAACGVAVAMVEFRNAVHPSAVPEVAPFPAGLNDCASGLRWVHANAGALGIDPARIVVAGESGGGNLVLALGMKLKQDGDIGKVKGLYAMCPYIAGHWPLPENPSSTDNEGILISVHDNRTVVGYGIDAFNACDPLAWPGMAKRDDVQGLPPTVISVNECDPLRDEGIGFYRLLLSAGVSARCRQVMGTCHGIEIMPVICPDISRATAYDMATFAMGPPQ